jgi:hypothetical protein
MAIVLEACTTEEQRSIVRFLWAKGPNAMDIRKEFFFLYGGNLVKKHGKIFVEDEEVETELRKCLRQQSKDFCVVGFDALVK